MRHPAHHDVRGRGDVAETARRENLEEHARKHRTPFNAEYGPRKAGMFRTQRDEAERRVAAGDEEVDRHVIHDVQHLLGAGICDGMVGRWDGIKENHARAENTGRHDLPAQADAWMHGLPDQ